MKSEVTQGISKESQIEFPMLMQSTLNGLIVLATGPGRKPTSFAGVSVGFGPSNEGVLWDNDNYWNRELFMPFTGTVTLSN